LCAATGDGNFIVEMPRPLRIALLVIETLWLSVLMPVHTRGQIAAPGAASDRQHAACCTRHDSSPRSDAPSTPPAQRPGPCAVCQFIAALQLPAPISLEPPRLDEAPLAIVPELHEKPAMAALWSSDTARAPPAPSQFLCSIVLHRVS
jgi:hypothetical protein